MASRDGSGPDDLTLFQRLVDDPKAHHIFLALRLIEARYRDAPPLGRSRRPREDRVRLGQEAELAFPPTTISSFTPAGAGPGELVNRFFGYFGPNGPLPTHLTEYARERQISDRDPTLIAFVNMLTHRFMSLLHRAWATGQPAPDFDRGPGGRIEGRVAALAGLGGPAFRGRDALPDLARLRFAGFLAPVPKSPEGLEAMLSSFFRVPVRVQEYVGCWLALEPGDVSRWARKARWAVTPALGRRSGRAARSSACASARSAMTNTCACCPAAPPCRVWSPPCAPMPATRWTGTPTWCCAQKIFRRRCWARAPALA
jgi:type VI secretion system protein ImpH